MFVELYGTKKLWVSIDRWGLMRPTKNIPMGKLPEQKIRTTVEDQIATEKGAVTAAKEYQVFHCILIPKERNSRSKKKNGSQN